MGFAVRVSTSTPEAICFMVSLWLTPKRCSSSTTRRPRSLNLTSPANSRCVPTTTSTAPDARPATTSRAWAGVRKRDSISTRTGYPA